MASRENAYNFTSVLFHWLTALWIVSMLAVGIIFHELSFLHPWRYALETAHIIFGVIGFFFFVVRVGRRFRNGFKHHPNHHLAERLLARSNQYLFLVLLLIVPVSGVVMVIANGYEFPGGLFLPASDFFYQFAPAASWTHEVLTKTLSVAILLHVAGAVKHALIDRDGTLMGILKPKRGGR